MARIKEAAAKWTITGTTGGAKAYKLPAEASLITVYFTSSSNCTATMQMQTAVGSSAGPWVGLGNSTALSTRVTAVHQFSGPLEWVRPYCSDISSATDVVEIALLAN
jgi:hypothetical protein